MGNTSRLGQFLVNERRARGISQDAAASNVGVSRPTWRAWEVEGVEPVKVAHLRKLARFLRLSFLELCGLLRQS